MMAVILGISRHQPVDGLKVELELVRCLAAYFVPFADHMVATCL